MHLSAEEEVARRSSGQWRITPKGPVSPATHMSTRISLRCLAEARRHLPLGESTVTRQGLYLRQCKGQNSVILVCQRISCGLCVLGGKV